MHRESRRCYSKIQNRQNSTLHLGREAKRFVCVSSGVFVDEKHIAKFAPEPKPNNRGTLVSMNNSHATHAHSHEGTLRKTTEQIGVTFEGELHESKGCFMVRFIRMPTPSKTDDRTAKTLRRVFVSLGGKTHMSFIEDSTSFPYRSSFEL